MMDSFTHRGIHLEYEVTGQGSPLVFLHGLGGSIQQIHGVYTLVPGVKLICLNQQGHGNSGADWESFGFDRLGEDVIALLDHLHLNKAAFAGISMGAAVCLNIALRFPERVEKLLLIRNAWTDQPMAEPVQNAYYDLGQALHRGGYEAFLQTEGWRIISGTSPYTRNAFTIPFQEDFNRENWQKYCILPGQAPVASLEGLREISVPTLILANRTDFCHPFAYGEILSRYIPGSVFREIPDKDSDPAGHKEQINRAVAELMKGPE